MKKLLLIAALICISFVGHAQEWKIFMGAVASNAIPNSNDEVRALVDSYTILDSNGVFILNSGNIHNNWVIFIPKFLDIKNVFDKTAFGIDITSLFKPQVDNPNIGNTYKYYQMGLPLHYGTRNHTFEVWIKPAEVITSIENTTANNDLSKMSIYTSTAILVKSEADNSDIANLQPGVYVLLYENGRRKKVVL